MKPTAFDSDTVLTEFLTDYLDGELSTAERVSFEEYLSKNKDEREFMRKAYKGKKALARLAKHMNDKTSVTA